jgi:hypothetical protein
MLAQHGFTNQPVGGCPVGESDDVDVTRIVETVLSELKTRGLG